jgi:hypothetical protein
MLEIHHSNNQMQQQSGSGGEHQLHHKRQHLVQPRRVPSADYCGLFGKPGKRGWVISIEWEVPLMAQETEQSRRGAVLGRDEATSKDEEMLSEAKCTVDRKKPASPAVVEIIPDTTMYPAQPESTTIDLYCMESNDNKQK